MHYYSFNIADYKKDTGHLTPIEHYIYRSLIDKYYLDETPIINETKSIMRRLQLKTDEDKLALENLTCVQMALSQQLLLRFAPSKSESVKLHPLRFISSKLTFFILHKVKLVFAI